MKLRLSLVCVALLCIAGMASGDTARLTCAADTNVSSFPSERQANYGASSRIRLKGIEMLGLFRFDLTPIAGWKVETATLHLRYAGNDRKLKTIGLSTIAAPWEEGSGSGETKPGEVCFGWAQQGKARWAGPDTDFTDVTFTAGHTLAAYANLKEEADGWFSVDVDPRLIQAQLAGLSYGLVVTDEKGQTRANNDVYSREQSNSAPYLIVTGQPSTAAAPAAPTALAAQADPRHADFEHGALTVRFDQPARSFGYAVRWRPRGGAWTDAPRSAMPFAKSVGPQTGRAERLALSGLPPAAEVEVAIAAVGEGGKRGPEAAVAATTAPAERRPAPLAAARVASEPGVALAGPAMRVWACSDTERINPVTGALYEAGRSPAGSEAWRGGSVRLASMRKEIVAFQIVIEPTGGGLRGVTVRAPAALRSVAGSTIAPTTWLFRDWYVKDGDWYPEACVPLSGPVDVPAADNAVPGQRNQSFFVDLLVPADAAPGTYTGAFQVSAQGSQPLSVPVTLEVNRLTMPDRLSFDVSLNTYGTVGGPFAIDDRTPEYRALEREYHRMAHLHRGTLAPLGYSQSGRMAPNYAPPLTGDGAAMRVSDWSAWDAQFGPYLDGSAFADLPRKGVPITHLYLPFNESWPADIRKHYHYEPKTLDYPATITEHALNAPPVGVAFDQTYRDATVAVVKQFAQHIRDKGWTRTDFQFYLNDKSYYKDPKAGGQGTSWWLLDEPNHRDDWLALAFLSGLYHEGESAAAGVRMPFREDISRPQWQRDYLDGLVELMVTSGEIYTKGPLLRDVRERLGARFWNYGAANPVRDSNVSEEAWAVRAWLAGADAIVPWQSIGEDSNYTKPDETALLLPGKRFGIVGPVASLRLKALRRAQQDVEYLVQYAAAEKLDRDQVGLAVADLLNLKATYDQRSGDDAGRYQFGPLRSAAFAAVRRAVAEAAGR